ncbi:unnamed protein product [Prorocentrum cordatum]|uniref:ADP,ATP carrier protein n=1 Tax=Prorocentrum cordatum TaxID=2364126 RepID=A0ABN9UUH2_9DINO|nr:unnamed protein product [Polarella glacialis]
MLRAALEQAFECEESETQDSDDSDSSSTEDDAKAGSLRSTCFVFAAIFSTTAALDVGLVLLTSSMTDVGVWFYEFIADEETAMLGKWLRRFAFSGGGFCLALVYLLEMWRWNKSCLRVVFKAFIVLATIVFALGILFATPKFPEIPVFYGLFAIMFATRCWLVFVIAPMGVKRQSFHDGCALAYIVISVVLFGVWLAWLTWPYTYNNSAFSEQSSATFMEDGSQTGMKASWILWCSPAALALAHFIMGSFVFMRGRFGLHHQDPGSVDLGIEVKISVMVLAFLGFAGYIAAILGAHDATVGKLVLTYTGITFLLVFSYLARWVGLKSLERMAEENSALQTAAGIVANDWVKALVVLLGPPVLVVFVVVEWIHQCCRRRLQRCGVLDSKGGEVVEPIVGARRYACLTWEANVVLHEGGEFLFGDTTSVLTKAIYWAIGIVFMMAFGSTCIWMFLQWVNSKLAGIPRELCLLIMYVVVLLLFLFPPISGQIIYGFAATVVQPLYGYGNEFWTGIVVSSTLCLLGKLVATAIQMKCIGGPGANSVYVKRSIGVHTSFMKALRYVLTRPGCSPGKILILTFGQDFATSVLTGILDLALVPMLIGTLPVIVVIVPCCVAFAYTLRAGEDVTFEAQHRAIAGLNLVLSGIVAAAGNAGIVYYVQEALHAHHDELNREGSDWMADPLEPQVLASVEEAKREEQKWSNKTSWERLPRSMRVCLGVGLGLSTVTVYVMMQPVHRAFLKFELGDKISDLPGGTPLGAVTYPLGWLVVFFTTTLVPLPPARSSSPPSTSGASARSRPKTTARGTQGSERRLAGGGTLRPACCRQCSAWRRGARSPRCPIVVGLSSSSSSILKGKHPRKDGVVLDVSSAW